MICLMVLCLLMGNRVYAGYYVTEQKTGAVIAQEDANRQVFPAGLTKLMSVLLFFEALEEGAVAEDTMVTISQNAASKGGTSVFLDAGTQYPFAELLQAVIVGGGNDAATALAECVAGSEAEFTARMNARAAELGLECSFADLTGLSAETRISAAALGKIAAELAAYEAFFDSSTIWTYRFTHESGRETEITSANRLIRSAVYDGMMTGSAREAGYCVAASLRQDGTHYLCIVLDADSSEERFLRASELLSTAAAAHTVREIVRAGEQVQTIAVAGAREVPICAAEALTLLLPGDVTAETQLHLREDLAAPLAAGEQVGELIVKTSDGAHYAVALIAMEDVAEVGFLHSLKRVLGVWLR